MAKEFEMIAKTFQGLEEVLAAELTELGANDIQIGRRMVSFSGDKEMLYKANFCLRTATRVLKPLVHFKAHNPDEVYEEVKKIRWEDILSLQTTFAVDTVVYSEEFRHSKFVAYKVKDAIVDYFREKQGDRPNISITQPDIRLNMHIAGYDCTLSLDSSGDSLHKRGYRVATVEAPMNEVLAAGIVKLTGWKGDTDFIDPMCGSGTIAIEAGLIAKGIAPGKFRKVFAFQKWQDYSADLFESIRKEAEGAERPFDHHIYASDVDATAVAAARANIVEAGLDEDCIVERKDFRDFKQPTAPALMIINPPYGVRLKPDSSLPLLYKMIGERLKHQFVGGEAWIICNHEELFDSIGLKPSLKIPLYNGSLDCQLQKYQIFGGKLEDFRREGGDIKTDEERRTMAQPHRFKQNRDFKKHIDEGEDYGEIPDYMIRKHREFEQNERRRERRESYGDRGKYRQRGGDDDRYGQRRDGGEGYQRQRGDARRGGSYRSGQDSRGGRYDDRGGRYNDRGGRNGDRGGRNDDRGGRYRKD